MGDNSLSYCHNVISFCLNTVKETPVGLFWQHFSTMNENIPSSTTYDYKGLESLSFFIFITYLICIWITGLSCDFVNYLIKFNNWRKRKDRPTFVWLIWCQFRISGSISKCKFLIDVFVLVTIFFLKAVLSEI